MRGSSTQWLGDGSRQPETPSLVRRYETDWYASPRGRRPNLEAYLTDDAQGSTEDLADLLRADLSLRREDGDAVPLDSYFQRFPWLDPEARVALLYEEYCLREEAGESPGVAEYLTRYPELADRLRNVLAIHEAVAAQGTMSFGPPAAAIAFPEVGQTIGGFRLVGELGHGSFGRVYLAEERLLADRPVALKVARAGSREPQTLARLQHTHIVPVHSYRVDKTTGLHLLCMPYLGTVTLGRLLGEPGVSTAEGGTWLLTGLDRLDAAQPGEALGSTSSGARDELRRRSYPRALAWWGARLAEALQHAHERGVLHRDIKPSNVLVTREGLPMLLDFNLAWETRITDADLDVNVLGGTLAYMAPEHLEALADGRVSGVDHRADLFSLGVVLFEAMGKRPYPLPQASGSVNRTLQRLAAERRAGPPSLRAARADAPPDLEAVITRCLEPDPAQRYGTAAELAADLQAVADDAALRHAREPWRSRTRRWLRRNRVKLVVAAPIVIAPTIAAYALARQHSTREHQVTQRLSEMKSLYKDGLVHLRQGQLDLAEATFDTITKVGAESDDFRVHYWADRARDEKAQVREMTGIRQRVDAFLEQSRRLWPYLLGFQEPTEDPTVTVRRLLQPFYVLEDSGWYSRAELALLDPPRRRQFLEAVDDILVLWVLALEVEQPGAQDALALRLCDRALRSTEFPRFWEALRAQCAARVDSRDEAIPAVARPDPASVQDARECFRWALLAIENDNHSEAITWLDRATRLAPGQFWYHDMLGLLYQAAGDGDDDALAHYSMAIVLDPGEPWVRFKRSQIQQKRGRWSAALEDLDQALGVLPGLSAAPVRLNRGTIYQSLGRFRDARGEYEAVLETVGAATAYGRAARWNLAKLDLEAGNTRESLDRLASLRDERPGDAIVRFGYALAELNLGQADRALVELDDLLARRPDQPEYLEQRARARLRLGDSADAVEDAAAAFERAPSTARQRLLDRARLAAGQIEDLGLLDPEELGSLPRARSRLRADLRLAADQLEGQVAERPGAGLQLAMIRSTLGAHPAALAAATRVVEVAPSDTAYLVRARVRVAAGDRVGALADIERGLALEPGDSPLLTARAQLALEAGRPNAALEDLERALRQGLAPPALRLRARCLMALGQFDAAVGTWSQALGLDAQDAAAFLGRGRAQLDRGDLDAAIADFEKAAAFSQERPLLELQIAAAYARILAARPDSWPRVWTLVTRGVSDGLARIVQP